MPQHGTRPEKHLEDEGSTLSLLLTTELEAGVSMYTHCLQRLRARCERYLHTVHSRRRTTFLVAGKLNARTLGLLLEDGLGLTTVTRLLADVTTLTLRVLGCLTSLVLSHLVGTN